MSNKLLLLFATLALLSLSWVRAQYEITIDTSESGVSELFLVESEDDGNFDTVMVWKNRELHVKLGNDDDSQILDDPNCSVDP